MTARGHWLEAATHRSLDAYKRRGHACVQFVATPMQIDHRTNRAYRTQSTVDFVGAWRGKPVAFDCKVTKVANLPHKNVHQHQLQFLRAFQDAGGVGALLVAFEQHLGASFLADITWYDDVVDELEARRSIPLSRFITGSERANEKCYAIHHGELGLLLPLAQGLDPLTLQRAT